MADIKFACPNCGQHITCDELWGGHQLDCPSCNNPLAVPGTAAPSAPAASGPSMPRPTGAPQARVTTNAQTPGPAQRSIPIRNLAPPAQKKKSPLVRYGTMAAVLIVLGAGGYYGYGRYMQYKADNTPPATAPTSGAVPGKGQRQQANAVGQDPSAPPASAPTNVEPLIPAVWTLDLDHARIPSGRANGSISGTNFVPEAARVDPAGNVEVLRLLQGTALSPDREVLIYLHLKAGEKLGGQTLNISREMIGAAVPQVTKRWKNNPKFAPQLKSFHNGYAMKLELGQVADGVVPGKIFLALPDPDQSVVAGTFKAIINTNVVADATVQSAPVMAPDPARAAADATFNARYGLKQ